MALGMRVMLSAMVPTTSAQTRPSPYMPDARLCGAVCQRRVGELTTRIGHGRLVGALLNMAEMAVTGSLTDEAGRCEDGFVGCDISKLSPYDLTKRFNGQDWPPFAHTMVGHQRIRNVRAAIESVVTSGIEGDFAELGSWRGGCSIFAKLAFDAYAQDARRVHVFDAFGEIPPGEFGADGYGSEARRKYLAVSEDTVRHNFDKYGALDDRVLFHKGLFSSSTAAFSKSPDAKRLAILRVDGNFYESYQDSMYNLYGFVPIGGIVIVRERVEHIARSTTGSCQRVITEADHLLPSCTPFPVAFSVLSCALSVL